MARAHHRRRRGGIALFVLGALLLAAALLFYTLLTASPKDVKLGVVSLDEGAQTTEGSSNLGSLMIDKLASGELFAASSQDAHFNSYSIELKTYQTQDDLNRALESDEVTGAIVIPEDYTKQKLDETTRHLTDGIDDTKDALVGAATQGAANAGASLVDVIVQTTADPVIQQRVGSSITQLLDTAGLATDSAYPGQSAASDADTSPIDSLCHLWLLLPPIALSIVLAAIYPVRRGETRTDRLKRLVGMLVASAILSAALAVASYFLLANRYHYIGAFAPSVMQLWIMSFLAMAFFGGLAQVRCWLAALAAGALLLAGAIMQWAAPDTVASFALPWVAETFTNVSLHDAASNIPGLSVWETGAQALAWYAGAGALIALGAVMFARTDTPDDFYDYYNFDD